MYRMRADIPRSMRGAAVLPCCDSLTRQRIERPNEILVFSLSADVRGNIRYTVEGVASAAIDRHSF